MLHQCGVFEDIFNFNLSKIEGYCILVMAFKYSINRLKEIKGLLPKRPSICESVFGRLKELGVLKRYRGSGLGVIQGERKIPVRITCNSTVLKWPRPSDVNNNNTTSMTSRAIVGEKINSNFVKPSLFININNQRKLQLGSINVRSIVNKATTVSNLIIDYNLDLLCVTETWLNGNDRDSVCIAELTPPGYSFLHVPRTSARGGGVGLLYRDSINVNKETVTSTFSSFEHLSVTLTSGSQSYMVIIIYRPPKQPKTKHITFTTFMDEVADFLEIPLLSKRHVIITGDFNIHMESQTNPEKLSSPTFWTVEMCVSTSVRQHTKPGTL